METVPSWVCLHMGITYNTAPHKSKYFRLFSKTEKKDLFWVWWVYGRPEAGGSEDPISNMRTRARKWLREQRHLEFNPWDLHGERENQLLYCLLIVLSTQKRFLET